MSEHNLSGVSLFVKNYKSFSSQCGFDPIKPINVVIGRNNSGKSALLDALDFMVRPNENFRNNGHASKDPEVLVKRNFNQDEIEMVFSKTIGSNLPGGGMDFKYGSKWIDKPITTSFMYNTQTNAHKRRFASAEPEPDDNKVVTDRLQRMVERSHHPFESLRVRRIAADRDIQAEPYAKDLRLGDNGTGATNVIHNFLHRADLDNDLVEKKLLDALNSIFKPQSVFSRIQTRILPNDYQEIFLEEEDKGLIPLTSSGSGLKTVVLILIATIMMPVLEKSDLNKYIFIFEEIENNLHPAIQRGMLRYLYDLVDAHGCTLFLSTHSNVLIDASNSQENAQIIHVTHNGKESQSKSVKTYIENSGVLDDLDIRASDLLQANSVIWVEGPSDRIYLKRWLDIFAPGEFQEGLHYSCMFYGGRLLSHLEYSGEEGAREAIDLLKINRKSYIVIDSDKETAGGPINATKRRVRDEVRSLGGYAWITKGKEIENYLSKGSIRKLLGKNVTQIDQFEEFVDYIGRRDRKMKKVFLRSKSLFSERLAAHIDDPADLDVLDLKERVQEITKFIRSCNSTRE